MSEQSIIRRSGGGQLLFWCPGCGCAHAVWVAAEGQSSPSGSNWGWNGSMDRPTFTPSVLVTSYMSEPAVTPENLEEWNKNPWPQKRVDRRCHSFVKDGQIQFLGDCWHSLRGQTVPLEEF